MPSDMGVRNSMASITPIRQKSLWQSYDMTRRLVGMLEGAIQFIPPARRGKHEQDLEDSYRDLEDLRVRAERLEGPRD